MRNIDRIDDVPGGIVLLRTDIHHYRVLAIDEVGCLLGGDGFAGLAAFSDDQQSEYNQKSGGQYVVVADKLDELLKK